MKLVDCHMHTVFSDGAHTVAEMVNSAEEKGLSRICITDHLAHPEYMDCCIDENQISQYESEIAQAREAHPNLEIVTGFEADWYRGCEKDISRFRAGATFLLGSVHYLGEYAIDWEEDLRIWEEAGPDEVWLAYCDAWCEACYSSANFDTMAHPDLPRLFAHQGYAPTIDLAPLWDDMAQAAKLSGVRVEINTAGIRKGTGDFYPQTELLQRFCAAGVPITIGSDAHHIDHIGFAFAAAFEQLSRVGYRRIEVPRVDGDWDYIQLDE